MTCGSCVANVKKVLEKHPTVKSASVNLTTATALVHVRLPDKVSRGGQTAKQVLEKTGKDLAEVLFLCFLFVTSACTCVQPAPPEKGWTPCTVVGCLQ